VIVAIFEWGWRKDVIGLQPTLPIPAYVPMLVFCIIFGLSMDYEVFLLSRVHEAWLDTHDAHRAVAVGIGTTARVITTASLVRMVLVPSIMSLLGSHAWWLPRWMEPIVPTINLEGGVSQPDIKQPSARARA
jgi:RND superfamily putative drug exporter